MVLALLELPAGVALVDVGASPQVRAMLRFKSTADALQSTAQLINGQLSKSVTKFLRKSYVDKGLSDSLAVLDTKLAISIKEHLGIVCIHGDATLSTFRRLREALTDLISDVSTEQMDQAALGLAHHLNRYKLKVSSDQVDLMVVQAVCLLEDLDKEINKYAMRAKEWYGWHFPELAKALQDNVTYAKVVLAMKTRFCARDADFTDVLDEEDAQRVRAAAMTSMGTEIADEDVTSICRLCREVVEASAYREQLAAYLSSRMQAIAPNLTAMVGELIGAKLVHKAGSLLALAKFPSSTVQILGAEKALFRALKKRQATPKYGILYNAQLVTRAPTANKGTMSRVLAAKTSLSARIDALTEEGEAPTTVDFRTQLESRLRSFEEAVTYGRSGLARGAGRQLVSGGGSATARPKRPRIEAE